MVNNSNLSGARRMKKLTPAQRSNLARLAKLNSERRAEVTKNAVPTRRLGRLFRAHVKSCPHRKLGRSYIDCDCPIYLGEGKDSDGKKINQRSLHTNYLPQAEERKAAIEKGAPLETIGGLGKLFRKHEKTCRFFGKGGIRHLECDCTVWMRFYKASASKRATPAYTRSLYTRDLEHACDLVTDSEKGAPLEMIQLLGRLFRQHEKTCPHFGKRGVSYRECSCNVWTSAYKGKGVDGKHIRFPRHSLRTRSWESGRKQLLDLAAPEGLARRKEKALAEERRSRDIRLRPFLAYVQQVLGSSGSGRVKLADIADVLGVSVTTAHDYMELAKELGYLDPVRHGRLKTFTVTFTKKGVAALEGGMPVVIPTEEAVPFDARPQDGPKQNHRGREIGDDTLRIIARWVEMGEPRLDWKVTDELAKVGYAREFAKAKPGSKKHKNLRDRAGNAIRRYLASPKKTPLS